VPHDSCKKVREQEGKSRTQEGWRAGGKQPGEGGERGGTLRPATMARSCLCLIRTPFGLPVDPDVYMITPIDSRLGLVSPTCTGGGRAWGGGCRTILAHRRTGRAGGGG
jgi:hypothetical protein